MVNAISSMFDKRYQLYVSAAGTGQNHTYHGHPREQSAKGCATWHMDENIFLLSDSGELINRLIADDDTPFIYEKIGTAYMIITLLTSSRIPPRYNGTISDR
ncbi:MAG: hypothetical protein MZV63_23530 [Marinilabiliales bacterium]|nr:hypothetical protein [Marinilabiliales bacterium]